MKDTDMKYPSMPDNGSDDEILTMAFVNMQPLKEVYDVERGWRYGTIFPSLNKPLAVEVIGNER